MGFNLRTYLLSVSLIVGYSAAFASPVSQAELIHCTSYDSKSRELECFRSLIEVDSPISSRANDANDNVVQNESQQSESQKRVTEEVSAVVTETKRDDYGLSKVQKQKNKGEKAEKQAENYTATVTKVTKGNYGILSFHTDKGHVWRQNEPDRFRYPRRQSFDIAITRGFFGDFRLTVGGKGPFTAVKRIK